MSKTVTVTFTMEEAIALVGGDYDIPDQVPTGSLLRDAQLVEARADARRKGRRKIAAAMSKIAREG